MSTALDHPGVTLHAEALIALRRMILHPDEATQLSSLPGGTVSKKRGQGQEMADVREYVSGDDIRHLDRGSTARTGTLHVRSFQEERDRVTLLVADFRPAMLWGSQRAFRSVAAAEALALIGWHRIEDGGRVGLLALGADDPVAVSARARTKGMLAVIGGMVRAHAAALTSALDHPRTDPPLDASLARVARVAPTGAEVIIASGFDAPGDALNDRLGQLSQRRTPHLIRIDDAGSTDLPAGAYPMRLPDGTKRRARISGPHRKESTPSHIAGFTVLSLDAGETARDFARQINARFGTFRQALHG